jgi:hypothetical protein
MKKAVAFLSAVLVVAAFIPRTASAEVTFDLGVKGGLSLAQMSFNGASDGLTNLARPVFGAFFAFKFSPALSIQPEIYYLTHGSARNQTLDDRELRTEQVLAYIDIPVLAKVRFMTERKLKPVVFAGPAVSFLTTAIQKFYENGVPGDEYDIKPFFQTTNFSAVFGAGLEYSMEKIILILDVRYDLGLVDIETQDDLMTMKTRAFLVMVGIGF